MKNLVKTFENFEVDKFKNMNLGHHEMDGDMEYGHHGMDQESHYESENYMFFDNLKTIQRQIDGLLEMDPSQVEEILQNGHGWAVDHIATSKDDIEEVFDFLMNSMAGHENGEYVHAEYEKASHDKFGEYEEGYPEPKDEFYPDEPVDEAGSMYMCEGCQSVYSKKELDESMTCNECGEQVTMMEGAW